jgi:hypothetical protein
VEREHVHHALPVERLTMEFFVWLFTTLAIGITYLIAMKDVS